MMPGLTMGESASFHNYILIWSMSFHRDQGGRDGWWKKKQTHVLESDKLRFIYQLHHLLNRLALIFSSVKW